MKLVAILKIREFRSRIASLFRRLAMNLINEVTSKLEAARLTRFTSLMRFKPNTTF